MGLFFKSKEEKEEIKRQEREIIRNSPVTESIMDYLINEFTGNGDGGLLSEFRSCDFAVLRVERTDVNIQIFHKRKKPDGSKTTTFGVINFESIGYSNLSYSMAHELEKVLFETLSNLECLKVEEISGTTYLYPVKRGW